MKKRLITGLLALAFVATVTIGCGNKEKMSEDSSATEQPTGYDVEDMNAEDTTDNSAESEDVEENSVGEVREIDLSGQRVCDRYELIVPDNIETYQLSSIDTTEEGFLSATYENDTGAKFVLTAFGDDEDAYDDLGSLYYVREGQTLTWRTAGWQMMVYYGRGTQEDGFLFSDRYFQYGRWETGYNDTYYSFASSERIPITEFYKYYNTIVKDVHIRDKKTGEIADPTNEEFEEMEEGSKL